ncbi:MAG: SRPBCC family protein [Bacteroidetes bacterium]|nr:SRPBCC family protein [Bacteroidota bacterium]MBS1757602.1 SRPBCC family protein [Bacteroidota bacterium]
MATIYMQTIIKSPVQIVFDLSRSIDLHKISTAKTNEQAIAGITTGLIQLNETVTWRAKHLGKYRLFTSKITAYHAPYFFKDEMQKGDFKKFSHLHTFTQHKGYTLLTDHITLEAPFGLIGKLVMSIFLKNYITKFISNRNNLIKNFAETDQWKLILQHEQQ